MKKNEKENAETKDDGRTYKMFELQMMQGQMEKLQEQKQKIEAKKLELEATTQSLVGIKSSSEANPEIMIPLGSGVFVKGQVKDNKNAIYSLGSGIAATNTIDNTIKFLESQSKMAQEASSELENQTKELVERAHKLIGELESENKEKGD